MEFGVLGRRVGRTLPDAGEDGHEVRIGARAADNERLGSGFSSRRGRWQQRHLRGCRSLGELVVNATAGTASLAVVRGIEHDGLRGKILVDVANPLDFSHGFPPSLSVSNTDSLGEQLQRELPDAKVVKTLNTVNCELMVDPGLVPGRRLRSSWREMMSRPRRR